MFIGVFFSHSTLEHHNNKFLFFSDKILKIFRKVDFESIIAVNDQPCSQKEINSGENLQFRDQESKELPANS